VSGIVTIRLCLLTSFEKDRPGRLHRRIGEALRNASAIGFIGNPLTNFGPVVLAVAVLDMRQQLGAFAHAGHQAKGREKHAILL